MRLSHTLVGFLLLLVPSVSQAQIVAVSGDKGLGTGIVLDSETVLTCEHGIGDNMKVTFGTKTRDAKVLVADKEFDLALLRVETEGPAVKICPVKDRPRGNANVIAVTTGGSFPCKITRETWVAWYTDFKAEPGNSGSALLNSDKQLIGVLKARDKEKNGAFIFIERMHAFLDKHYKPVQKASLEDMSGPKEVHWPGFITMWVMIGGGVFLVSQLLKKGT